MSIASLSRVEVLKLRTTPAIYVSLAIIFVLSLASVVTTIELAGQNGAPALGSVANVSKTLSVSALTAMVMMVVGILLVGGEYRHRTIIGTYLAEPARGRVLAAKLATVCGLGAVVGAFTFGLALAVAVPLYATKGVHHLAVDIPQLWIGAVVATACYGLLGVALGALTRNTVAAIIGSIVWVQFVEVVILQNALPGLAKWLPTGAAVALTTFGHASSKVLAPAAAAAVLVGWTALLAFVATRITMRRDVN